MPPSSAAAYQSLQSFDQSRPSPQAVQDQAQQKYGVSGLGSQLDALRSMTGNLQTSIKNVDPSVTGRTQGSLVTEAARNAIVNNERAPLMDQLGTTNQNLSATQGDYDRATGLASNYANSILQNDQDTYGKLFGQYQTSLQAEQQAAADAEKKREFDASLAESQAARRAAASGGGGLSLGGISGGGPATGAGAVPIIRTKNAVGGYSFSQGGRPVTMGQYLASQGLAGTNLLQAAASLLGTGSSGDKGIANAISSGHYTPAQLEKLYPQVFGGL